VLQTIKLLREEYPGLKIITGLSNISFGLPARKQINRAFLVACMVHGLNGALIDPLDQVLMSMMRATEALLDKDPYCSGYLKAYRAGLVVKD
jgi:5-methyltetrahydrofolate--homocysteine methyltransferase